MCKDKDRSLLTEREMFERWKQHFDDHMSCQEREVKDVIYQLNNNDA